MDEGRKRVLLIAASILAARKLAQFDGEKRVPATVSAIADAVRGIIRGQTGRSPITASDKSNGGESGIRNQTHIENKGSR